MSKRAEILVGMAMAIWDIATEGTGRRASDSMLEKGAPAKAARALADLYENSNDESLQAMFEGQKKRTRNAEAFGFELARAAIEATSNLNLGMKRSLEEVGIYAPNFTVSYDKKENVIAWDGSANPGDDEGTPVFDVEGFPRTGHRLVKPNATPAGNEQWYRLSWTLPDGTENAGIYPHSYLETMIRYLRSDFGLSDYQYTVTPIKFTPRHNPAGQFTTNPRFEVGDTVMQKSTGQHGKVVGEGDGEAMVRFGGKNRWVPLKDLLLGVRNSRGR